MKNNTSRIISNTFAIICGNKRFKSTYLRLQRPKSFYAFSFFKGSTKKKEENVQSPQHNTQNSKKKIGSSSSQQDFEDVDDVYAGLKGTELIFFD